MQRGIQTDLVDNRRFDIRVHHLLQVPDSEVADTHAAYEPFFPCLEDCLPALRALLWPTDGRMHEVQVDTP